jgi:aryl-alcohol dehydrogenase-like predicted oxidoreductase
MPDHLNLIYREEEREMLPLCREENRGDPVFLASGRLTRDRSSERTHRSQTDQSAKSKYDATAETDRQVIGRVAEIAEKRGVTRVHIALAWLLQKKPVNAPIVGADHSVFAFARKLNEAVEGHCRLTGIGEVIAVKGGYRRVGKRSRVGV